MDDDDFVLDEWPTFMDVEHEEEVFTSESEPEPGDAECESEKEAVRAPEQASGDKSANHLISESEHEPTPKPEDGGSRPGSRPDSEHESEPEDDDRDDDAPPLLAVQTTDVPMVEENCEHEGMPRLLPVLEYPMSPDPEQTPVATDSQESKVAWDPQESPMSPDPSPEVSDSYSPTEWVFEVSPFYDYLYDVATTGKSSMPWEEVQPAFIEYFEVAIHKLKKCFRHFSHETCDISEGSEVMRIHRFVCQKIEGFNDFPFTFRRLCELLVDPTRCYTKLPKFMRALERVINVVSTCPLYPQRKPPPKPEQEEPKIESLFFRSPKDEFDQLHVSDYGPEENEESADSSKSMWDSDESPMCCTDSTCSTCDSRSTCDDSDAIPRSRESQDDLGGGGDSKTRIERQKAGADVAIPVLSDDSGPEYDADTDENADEQVPQRVQKRIKRRNKNCRKRRRNDEAFMREFAECTISKKPMADDQPLDGSGVDTGDSRLSGQDDSDVHMAEAPPLSNNGINREFQQLLDEARVKGGPGNYEAYEVVTEDEIRREIAGGRVYEIFEVVERYDQQLGREAYEILEHHDELPELPLDCEHAHAFLDDDDEDMEESEIDIEQ